MLKHGIADQVCPLRLQEVRVVGDTDGDFLFDIWVDLEVEREEHLILAGHIGVDEELSISGDS